VPVAFVLINAEIGSEEEVLKGLQEVEGAKIEADTMDKLKDVVTWHIRRLNKVRSSLTMIVVEGT